MKEQMREAFKAKYDELGVDTWNFISYEKIFEYGYQAALSSVPNHIEDKLNLVQDRIAEVGETMQSQAQQPNKEKILVDAITEVLRVLETDNEAILDTVWTTRGDNETLWEHCAHALEQVTGIEYKPAEQLALDLQSQAQQPAQEPVKQESNQEHVCNYSPSLIDGGGTMVCSCGNWK